MPPITPLNISSLSNHSRRPFSKTIDTLKDEVYTIAIIGRPNVGKSSLFNKLVGKQLALVDKTPEYAR